MNNKIATAALVATLSTPAYAGPFLGNTDHWQDAVGADGKGVFIGALDVSRVPVTKNEVRINQFIKGWPTEITLAEEREKALAVAKGICVRYGRGGRAAEARTPVLKINTVRLSRDNVVKSPAGINYVYRCEK
ncbi:MAG: hypothetical protein GDA53_08700 [Rhodobacteraceae bacterium]|nr:hypothetical protein [Paracoccaceae bacterium]